jgi:hypothetical protein
VPGEDLFYRSYVVFITMVDPDPKYGVLVSGWRVELLDWDALDSHDEFNDLLDLPTQG